MVKYVVRPEDNVFCGVKTRIFGWGSFSEPPFKIKHKKVVAISNHLQSYTAIDSNLQPFWGTIAMYSNVQIFTAIYNYFQPFPAMYCYFLPFTAM